MLDVASGTTHDCLYGQTQQALTSLATPIPISRPKSSPRPNPKKSGARHDVKNRHVITSRAEATHHLHQIVYYAPSLRLHGGGYTFVDGMRFKATYRYPTAEHYE